MKNKKAEHEKIYEEVNALPEESAQVFQITTDAIMNAFPEGTVSPQDIIDGLEAVIKVIRLHDSTEPPRGH